MLPISSLRLAQAYYYDFIRFNNSGFSMKKNESYENLRSRITFHYHALEKGMSNANLRLGFGNNAFKGLFESMELYKKSNYSLNDIRYMTALSTINQYIKLHRDKNFNVFEIETKYNQLLPSEYSKDDIDNLGGYYNYTKADLLSYKDASFDVLAEKRYSVRDFGPEPVELNLIDDAIKIATKTPSVCNRQAWKVYVIKNIDMIKYVLMNQNGLTGNGSNLDTLLVITCDNQYLGGFNERNQSFVDGGMFAMSLLYALENQGLASCTLNANLSKDKDIEIRKIVDIGYSEDIILFIAVGNYPEEIKVAKSHRDSYELITNYRL